jgi:FkbM family methyltransferase
VKALIQKSLSLIGLEIKRRPPSAFDIQRRLCQKNDPVIFDVGANIGQTLVEYRRLFPSSKIFAFEPFPDSFLVLKQSFGQDRNTMLLELALSDHSGEEMLFCNNAAVTNSLLETSKEAERFWGDIVRTKNVVAVKVETLETFCNIHGINHIDILKIDTQGTELCILRGARCLLKLKQIEFLYLEITIVPTYVNQARFDEVFSLLYSFDYRLVDIYPHKKNSELLFIDALFAKR